MKRNIVSIIFIVLLSTGLIYLVLDKISEHKSRELLEDKYRVKNEENIRLKEETVELKETLKKEKKVLELPPGKLADVFGDDITVAEILPKPAEVEDINATVDCDSINKKIINFFSYLDKKEYIKEYQLKEGSYAHFKKITAKLNEQIPIIEEKNSPGDILKNTYHFYRTINKRNIILIKEITEKEKNILEQTMDYFYQQQIHCEKAEKFFPSFDALYEYAHFFLNSIAGKAYLFRLESRLRILLLYYSTMIIHEANMREINKYGIDIRPYLNKLEDELKNYSKFYYSDKYLREIEMVKQKYPVPSPVRLKTMQ